MALARSYLAVERVRFGERLKVEESIAAESEDCLVPALILQPLVENAVKHGIAGLLEGGSIRLSARRSSAGVTIAVENEYDAEDFEDEHGLASAGWPRPGACQTPACGAVWRRRIVRRAGRERDLSRLEAALRIRGGRTPCVT